MNGAKPVVRVEDLQVVVPGSHSIVEGVCFDLAAGEVLGLVGESGSGKTTVALALLGYARKGMELRGSAFVDGVDVIAASDAVRKQIRGQVVSYGVDLPRPPPAAGAPRTALVVIPDTGVQGAREHAPHVVQVLKEAGWEVVSLTDDEATRDAILRWLPKVQLAHFFMHGSADGRDGWQSRLLLRSGESLSVADLMRSDRAPPMVVLARCEGARTPRTGASYVQGPTMAHAFMIAGTKHVLASSYKIDASATDDLVRELYKAGRDALLADPATALRDARNRLQARPDHQGDPPAPLWLLSL